jgi:hypothetical protein
VAGGPVGERMSPAMMGCVVDDAVAARLSELEGSLRQELANHASVTRRAVADGSGSDVDLTPVDAAALRVGWTEFAGFEIVVGAGHGGRWELEWSVEDADLTEQIVRAVIAGRAREWSGFGRSRVEITYADGSITRSTVYDGCLAGLVPVPGWRRFSRKVIYSSYLPPDRPAT